ncbi:MAG: hypothetical protein GC159_04925 [Phycisphaera sp.]|nr:hypothetical protein [Phycisphaera sp.]
MMMTNRTRGAVGAMVMAAVLMGAMSPAMALDAEHRAKAEATLEKAIRYLRANQAEDGSWSPQPGPGITALVVAGMLRDPAITKDDPAVAKALNYVLSRQKSDGGIYDQILGNYNTSLSLMAMGLIKDTDPKIADAVKKAQDYVRNQQWADGKKAPDGEEIVKGHRWYGGAGYGDEGRPDMSNTATMIAGLHDSGLVCTDPAYARALEFISSLQGSKANTKFGDKIEPNGGFIYASSRFSNDLNNLETKVGTSENAKGEDVDNGAGIYTDADGKSRLRTYGSMTYAGFMSYLYAQLDRDDARVKDAYSWITHNYNLNGNPGVGMQGYYYYLYLTSRALNTWGDPVIETADGKHHEWANELIDKLSSLQRADGSWVNKDARRWGEGDVNLCTAYAVMALQVAMQ